MATDERFIKAVCDDFLKIIEEGAKEDTPPSFISFPNDEWGIFDGGSFTLIYRRPETRKAVALLLRRVREKRDWAAKWSATYVDKHLSIALSNTKGADADVALAAFDGMAKELDASPPELDAIFVVGGLVLAQDELKIGDVRLFRVSEKEAERLRNVFYTVLEGVTNPAEDKKRLREQADGFIGLLANRTVAEVPTVGDRDKAKEQAAKLIEPILDFLQLMVAIDEPSVKNIRIIEGGDLLARQPPRFFIARDQSEVHWDLKLAAGHRFELTDARLRKIADHGFEFALAAITKDASERSDFELLVLNAIHWIADAEKQERLENRITSYITAIEQFFTSEDGPITRDLSESVAYLLAPDLDARRRLKKKVADLYKERSKVSHEGRRQTLTDTVSDLKNIAINVVAVMSSLIPKLGEKGDVQALFSDLRLSAVFDPATYVDGAAEDGKQMDSNAADVAGGEQADTVVSDGSETLQ